MQDSIQRRIDLGLASNAELPIFKNLINKNKSKFDENVSELVQNYQKRLNIRIEEGLFTMPLNTTAHKLNYDNNQKEK